MGYKVEKLEGSMAKLIIDVSAEEFEAACEKAYQRNKKKISVPGFRAGKVPRKVVEKMYGIREPKFSFCFSDMLSRKPPRIPPRIRQ